MIQGIHVGVSISDPNKQRTKIVTEVLAYANKIDARIPKWYSRQTHGIFIGNVGIAHVKDNIIMVEKINNLNLGLQLASLFVGIQMIGYHGKMVLVASNVISNADTGIRFRTIGFLPFHDSKTTLRAIMCNVVYGAAKSYDKSNSIEEDSIKFGNQNNVP